VSTDEIIRTIDRDRAVFNLSVAKILELKKAGVADRVLRHMLKTNTGATARQLTPSYRPTSPTVQAASDEELIEQVFDQGALEDGWDDAEDGDWVDATETFREFLRKGGYARGSPEHYAASFGIGYALVEGELYQAGAMILLDVLLEGPRRPLFQPAFRQLRKARRMVEFTPPQLEKLLAFSVGRFSSEFRDEYHYVLGEFLLGQSNLTGALQRFKRVRATSPDYARARYLAGLAYVRSQLYRSALQSFMKASEADDSDSEVGDLANIAVARLAVEAGHYEVANAYYEAVSTDSDWHAAALYESIWSTVLAGDSSQALELMEELPTDSGVSYPDLILLKATIQLHRCQHSKAHDTLSRLSTEVRAMAAQRDSLERRFGAPSDYWRAFGSERGAARIDPRLRAYVKQNPDFRRAAATIRQIDIEKRELNEARRELRRFVPEMLAKLAPHRRALTGEAGIAAYRSLRSMGSELADLRMKQVEFEIDLAADQMDNGTCRKQTEVTLRKRRPPRRRSRPKRTSKEDFIIAQRDNFGAGRIVIPVSSPWHYVAQFDLTQSVNGFAMGVGYLPQSGFYGTLTAGIDYQLLNPDDWCWDPEFHRFIGEIGGGYLFENRLRIGLIGGFDSETGFYIKPDIGEGAPTLEATQLSKEEALAEVSYVLHSDVDTPRNSTPVTISLSAKLGGKSYHRQEKVGSLVLGRLIGRFGYYHISSDFPPLGEPKATYEKKLELVLVDSRPIEEGDLRSDALTGELGYHLQAWRTWSDGALTAGALELVTSAAVTTVDGIVFGRFRLRAVGGVDFFGSLLSIVGRANLTGMTNRNTPYHELAAIGGEGGMLLYGEGAFPNLYSAVGGVEVGFVFARFFVEYGSTSGIGLTESRLGYGLVLGLPPVISTGSFGMFPSLVYGDTPDGTYFGIQHTITRW